MSDFSIRAAMASDAADLAILENMASRGLAQWFWQGAVNMGKAVDAFQWGRDRILKGNGPFGWFNSVVAERESIVLGSAMFYEAETEEPDLRVPQLAVLSELRNSVKGSWYLDSIGVYPNERGTGVGKALMENYLDQGRELGFTKASLIAEDSNEGAVAMYRAFGFKEHDRRPYENFGLKSDTENWLLFTAELN